MTTSGRALETHALFKAARKLAACLGDWDAPERPDRLKEALRYNQRLWTFFQSELSRPEHHLELQLRVNLLTISAFIDRRTFELLARPNREKLQPLIDINRNVAAGLSAKGQAPSDPSP